jgi:hypothetical protein
MIKTILERRDQMIEDMRKQGMSDDEIRERLRQRMQQMRDAQNGGGSPGSGMSFRDLDRQKAAAGDSAKKLPAGRHLKKGGAAAASGTEAVGGTEAPVMKPGAVYVLRAGHPERVSVMMGISDGAYTEVSSDQLKAGDPVIVGLETTTARGAALTPPPGMGGPFGGGRPGGGGAGGGRGGR